MGVVMAAARGDLAGVDADEHEVEVRTEQVRERAERPDRLGRR